MKRHIILKALSGRFLQSVISLWLISVLFFIIIELSPGDYAMFGAGRGATASMLDTVRFELGLHESSPLRYLKWVLGVLSGDLGTSWWSNVPVSDLVSDRLWHSAWLFTWAALFTVPISMALAILSVVWKGGYFDRASSVGAVCLMSIPEFAMAYGLLILLSLIFDVFPSYTLFGLEMSLGERLYGSALPILSLSAVTVTPMFRLSRAAMINVLSNEYIQMAELKGLGKWRIVVRHVLPNAIAPMANATSLALANLFFGLVIVEVIYSYPGLGSLLFTAAQYQDMPLILACGLISAVVIISLTWAADTIGLLANPRLRDLQETTSKTTVLTLWHRWKVFRKPTVSHVVAGLCVIVITSGTVFWHVEGVEQVTVVTTPEPASTVRDRLKREGLLGDSPYLSEPVHYAYFQPFREALPALHAFHGMARVQSFVADRRTVRGRTRTYDERLPAFDIPFTTHGDVLLPLNRDILTDLDKDWSLIVSAGKVWHEPADEDWSRAAFPFTLASRSGFGPHYGVATFLYNDTTMSDLRLQSAQETANWAQYDIWGQAEARYLKVPLTGVEMARQSYNRLVESQVDMRPWSDLADQHWRSLERFDGTGNRENISVSGLMIDDVFYLRHCRTRAGPHPFCRSMRHGVYSITKSMGAGVAMLWLAQKYGPDVFNEKIVDYVTIPAKHDGWHNVTFGNALDMTTGIGNVAPYQTDEYVEADSTHITRTVWFAHSIQEKLDAIAVYDNYPWPPGTVFRYRTPDTTVLSGAMESYLRAKEGTRVDLWDQLTDEVFAHLGIDHLPVRRSTEPDGRPGTPLLGWGLYMTIDETLKIARLLQDHGEVDGKQLLHRDLTERFMSNDFQRGFPNGWRGKGRTEGHYEASFWLTPHEEVSGCDVRVPVMAGFGGNYVIIMPNRTIGLRFADGHDENPDTWDSGGIRTISERIRQFCP